MFNGLSVLFPNVPQRFGGYGSDLPPNRVYKMSYRQANYEHDYARVFFRDWEIDISKIRPGSPMEVRLDGKSLVGYVHDVSNIKDGNGNFTEVGFIGASYVMRQSSQEIYREVTASQIAEKIARKYGFAYKITPHPRVYKQVSQAGLTDWQFLVKLAKQCGYFLRAESTNLYFQPVMQEFEEKINEAPIFSKSEAGFKSANLLYSFEPVIGETLGKVGAEKAATSVAGIDAETGQLFKYTKQKRVQPTRQISQPELFDKHATTVVAPSYDIAKFEAEGLDEGIRFPYVAEAEILGTSKVFPGGPIYIQNVGPKFDGYWTVIEVVHEIIEESLNMHMYTSKLVLGVDSLGGSAVGKYPSKPNFRGVRAVSPAVRGTKVKPNNIIKTPNIKVVPPTSIKLVDRINRAAPEGARVAQTTWSSTSGSLVGTPQAPGRSAVAAKKAVKHFGRQ